MWWIWVIIAILTAIIFRWITKPRLPQLSPAFDFNDRGGIRPISGHLQHDVPFWSLRNDRGHFGVTAELMDDDHVVEMVGTSVIGLEAVSRKRFKLDKATCEAFALMVENGDECTAIKDSGESVALSKGSSFDIIRRGGRRRRTITVYMTKPTN